jgi:hypothetical protein
MLLKMKSIKINITNNKISFIYNKNDCELLIFYIENIINNINNKNKKYTLYVNNAKCD